MAKGPVAACSGGVPGMMMLAHMAAGDIVRGSSGGSSLADLKPKLLELLFQLLQLEPWMS